MVVLFIPVFSQQLKIEARASSFVDMLTQCGPYDRSAVTKSHRAQAQAANDEEVVGVDPLAIEDTLSLVAAHACCAPVARFERGWKIKTRLVKVSEQL